MDDNVNLKQLIDELSSVSEEDHVGTHVPLVREKLDPIGKVLDIAGSGSQASLDPARLLELAEHHDPSVAMSGQVGSQVKMVVGKSWLIANVRTMRMDDNGNVVAAIDFLGEGNREPGGGMSGFRR